MRLNSGQALKLRPVGGHAVPHVSAVPISAARPYDVWRDGDSQRQPVHNCAFVVDVHEVSSGVVEEVGFEHSDRKDFRRIG
jgi:hypothetical protein